MTSRREAREMALKLLYIMEMTSDFTHNWYEMANTANFLENEFYLEEDGEPIDNLREKLPQYEANPLLSSLISHVLDNRVRVDLMIESVAEHWTLNRIAIIDKNILRLGICELQYLEDIPASVTINEYVEIAKIYGSDDSPKFINGILDKVTHQTNPTE